MLETFEPAPPPEQLAYWERRLQGAPALLELPCDRPRPPRWTGRLARFRHRLPNTLVSSLAAPGDDPPSSVLPILAAFLILLGRSTRQNDLSIGYEGPHPAGPEGSERSSLETLVLRTDLAGDPTFAELLRRIREGLAEASEHGPPPFDVLVESLHVESSPAYRPLVQVMFQAGPPPAPIAPLAPPHPLPPPDLALYAIESAKSVELLWTFRLDLFDSATIQRMHGCLTTLLETAVEAVDRPISTLPLLTEAERTQLLVEWNDTRREYPRQACVHHLIEAQAARTPTAVAIAFEGRTLTYEALNRRANQIAHRLRSLGARPGVLVGFFVERGLDMAAGLLGILKSGAAYVPLDPGYPRERLAWMAADAGLAVLLTQQSLAGVLQEHAPRVLCLDAERERLPRLDAGNPASGATARDLAYVIYTSGSTGRPKGVQVQHRAVVNFLSSMQRSPGMTAGDCLLAVTTLSFDIAGLEMYLPLTVGARVEIVRQEVASSGALLADHLTASAATVMQATPAAWRLLVEAGWPGDRRLKALCGGEALPWDLALQLLDRCGSLWNLYGPTETTIWSSIFPVVRSSSGPLIGRPIANTQFYILDAHLDPVPVGVPGELYIGGDGLAAGYRNHPDWTAERFIPNPFAAHAKARLYRTGDLARYRPDGCVEFLGRADDQVKIRGFRIEPGEIEAVLARHSAVHQAVAVVREDRPGDKQLVAYVVPALKQGRGAPASPPARQTPQANLYRQQRLIEQFRTALEEQLPRYMIPSAFVLLESLPLTPSAKVDRKALPAPAGPALRREVVCTPRDDLEADLVDAWQEVFDLRPIGVQDNFFQLGGHSLLAARLVVRMEKAVGRRIPLTALIQAPTIEKLAAWMRESSRPDGESTLRTVQQGRSRPPFFCLMGGTSVLDGSGSLQLHRLAQLLGPDQPVYTFQRETAGQPVPAEQFIEDLAPRFVEDLLASFPQGPYHLGGYSFGALVALEMARLLHARGRSIGCVALLDLWGPGYPRPLSRVEREARQWEKLRLLPFNEKIRHVANRFRGAAGRRLSRLNGLLGKVGLKFPEPLGEASPEMTYVVEAFYSRREIMKPYPGRVTLFRAEEALDDPTRVFDDPWNGCGALAGGGVEVRPVPGDHFTILAEPGLRVLAAELSRCLGQLRATA